MKHRSLFFRLIVTTTFVVVFALPSFAHAATVCCACKQTADPSKATSCLLIDTSIISRTEDCPTIPANTTLGTDWTCEKTTDAECRRIFEGGVCVTAPQASSLEKKTTAGSGDVIGTSNGSQSAAAMVIPDFNTPIPSFVAPQDGGLLLGAYIVAIYRYGLSIGVIAATIMFIWGGFIYLVGSSGMA
ncbi:MAG: hypothetical protein KIH65_004075, partial [Candidatus Uhrbacteria bacterium]|nr:hypothetical protein [Candidatus Uhrbacteria bacterium]